MKTARPGIPRFEGPFKTFSVALFSDREKGIETRLLVYSQGSRAAVNRYLWLKFLWDELTRDEFKLFLALPETLNDEMKYATLRVVLLFPKKVIRERLNRILERLKEDNFPRESYLGYKRLDVEIHEITRRLPRVPKFSGWIKSSSAVGSKKSSRGPSYLEPLAILEDDYSEEIFDWYHCLSVDFQSLTFPVSLYIDPEETNNSEKGPSSISSFSENQGLVHRR